MANPVVITITNAYIAFGTGATLTEYQCQVTEASINATPNLQDVPATWCAPASQSPAATGFELAITWLQDWTNSAGGLSKWAFDNDTKEMDFAISLVEPAVAGTPDPPVATGKCRIVAGGFGGAAGTPLTTSATWPIIGKPNIDTSAVARSLGAEQQAPAEEPAAV